MDKGWGLTLASDPVSVFSSNNSNNSPVGSFLKVKRDFSSDHNMADSRNINNSMFQFPVSLSAGKEEVSSAAAHEVDFFKEKINRVDGHDSKSTSVIVKKENSLAEVAPRSSAALDVNVREIYIYIYILNYGLIIVFLQIEILIFFLVSKYRLDCTF
jgi:hypothetical protein